METASITTAACPYCGAGFDFSLWPTLDTELDPKAADRLVHGMLFEAVCPECGCSFSYVYPIFYHDPLNQVALWYDPTSDMSGIPLDDPDLADPSLADPADPPANDFDRDHIQDTLRSWVVDPADPTGASTLFYVLRRVSTHYELAEKALASRLAVDDRVLELAKVRTLRLKYGDDMRAIRNTRLFLDDVEKDGTIRMLGLFPVPASDPGSLWGPGAPAFIKEERLHLVKVGPDVIEELRATLDPVDQNPPDCVVDRVWAMRELGLFRS